MHRHIADKTRRNHWLWPQQDMQDARKIIWQNKWEKGNKYQGPDRCIRSALGNRYLVITFSKAWWQCQEPGLFPSLPNQQVKDLSRLFCQTHLNAWAQKQQRLLPLGKSSQSCTNHPNWWIPVACQCAALSLWDPPRRYFRWIKFDYTVSGVQRLYTVCIHLWPTKRDQWYWAEQHTGNNVGTATMLYFISLLALIWFPNPDLTWCLWMTKNWAAAAATTRTDFHLCWIILTVQQIPRKRL